MNDTILEHICGATAGALVILPFILIFLVIFLLCGRLIGWALGISRISAELLALRTEQLNHSRQIQNHLTIIEQRLSEQSRNPL
jgi:hypothetical protein